MPTYILGDPGVGADNPYDGRQILNLENGVGDRSLSHDLWDALAHHTEGGENGNLMGGPWRSAGTQPRRAQIPR